MATEFPIVVAGVNDLPGRAGKRPQGEGEQVTGHQRRKGYANAERQNCAGVLRERGRKGLPLDELTGSCSTRQCICWPYGRIYSNDGAMTPGATRETVDGMSRARSALHHRCGAPRALPVQARQDGSGSRKEREAPPAWAGRPGRDKATWRSGPASCWRPTTSRCSPTAPTVSVPAGAATRHCAR